MEKVPPTRPLRVSIQSHATVKVAAAELDMSMQEVVEYCIAHGMPKENPKQPGWAPIYDSNAGQ